MRGEAVAHSPLAGLAEATTALRDESGVLTRPAEPVGPRYITSRTGRGPGPSRRSHEVSPSSGTPLRRLLVVFDVVAYTLSWTVALAVPVSAFGLRAISPLGVAGQIAIAAGCGMGAMVIQRLYLARVCSIRAEELSRTARASVASGVLVVIISEALHSHLSITRAVIGSAVAFLSLGMLRGIYGSMLRERRARGLNRRPIVIVGTNNEARELADLVVTHPEFGYEPVGVIGRLDEYQWWPDSIPYLGTVEDASDLVSEAGANGVLIAASSLEQGDLKRVTREFLSSDLHVHLSSGLWGIDHRRLRSVPLAHEPIFYLERISLSWWNKATKRSLDLLVAVTGLIVVSPILVVAAIATKLGDRGPVLFKQVRVGKGGRHFTVYKMRTMVPNAEKMLTDTARENGNLRDGPLFKLENDPRRTKVGRIMEAASIDELPQLFNVLNGTMSLVGPRPALPSEVAQFDEELLERFSVPPGITGLWQVEARDNPSFSAYRRLDLFYVENWSVTLDLAILVETFSSVLSRLARGKKHEVEVAPAA